MTPRPAATRPPDEVNEVIDLHNRSATFLIDVPQAPPLGSAPRLFLRSVPLPPHVLPTRRRRYFKCRCGFTPTTSTPVKRAINHPPPSHRHLRLRLQDADSRLRGERVLHFTASYSKCFSIFQNAAKRFIYLQRFPSPEDKKKREKKTK